MFDLTARRTTTKTEPGISFEWEWKVAEWTGEHGIEVLENLRLKKTDK
jgi:hypothetical protein